MIGSCQLPWQQFKDAQLMSLYLHSFFAKQWPTLLWIEILDSLLYAPQVMPPNDYICYV